MLSTMQDLPLTTTMIFRHGKDVHGRSEVVTVEAGGIRRASFAEVARRTEQLAAALRRLGVDVADRVATFMWNRQEHLEAYFAIPGTGAVLHTLNIRLFPEQLVFIVNHAEDRVVLVDDSLVPLLAPLVPLLPTVEHYVVVGSGDAGPIEAAGGHVLRYDDLLAAEEPGYVWPELDERMAAAMCYTSGTTGDPKGVVYSHRSTWLHTLGMTGAGSIAITELDRVLPVVPMFHANAWGIPYGAWTQGADLVLPGPFLQAEALAGLIESEAVTIAAAVPTIWSDVLRYVQTHPVDLSSLRHIVSGGSAVPRALIEAYRDTFGIPLVQGWGMTETSPVATMLWPPKQVAQGSAEETDFRVLSGRIVPGVELRIVGDDGTVLPRDGEAVGEVQARGPWITGSYYKGAGADRFDDGWLRTGDIASISPDGFLRVSDRTKDVIKSGGEWISSVDLEGHLMAHPAVAEAAVIAVPSERWGERPLACVVCATDHAVAPKELQEHLREHFSEWQLPEHWAFVAEVPKTSVGKFDKKALRARHAAGELDVVGVD